MLLDHNFPTDQRVENEAKSLVDEGFEVTVIAIGKDKNPSDPNNFLILTLVPAPKNHYLLNIFCSISP